MDIKKETILKYREFLDQFCEKNNLNKYSIQNWSLAHRNDKKLMMAALHSKATSLEHFSENLKNDPEVVLTAIHFMGITQMSYASNELKEDKGFVLWALDQKINVDLIGYCHPSIKNDKEVILTMLEHSPFGLGLMNIGDDLRNEMDQIKWTHWSTDFKEYKGVLRAKIELEKIAQSDILKTDKKLKTLKL